LGTTGEQSGFKEERMGDGESNEQRKGVKAARDEDRDNVRYALVSLVGPHWTRVARSTQGTRRVGSPGGSKAFSFLYCSVLSIFFVSFFGFLFFMFFY
jgi:hypothetical protein